MDMKLGGFLKYKYSKISNNLAIVWLSENWRVYLYWNTLETHHCICTVLSNMVELRIFSWSYFMFVYNEETICCNLSCSFWRNNDVSVFQQFAPKTWKFENNQCYLVGIRPNSWKNTKSFGSHRLFTLSEAAFLCWRQLQIFKRSLQVYGIWQFRDTFVSYATCYGLSVGTTRFWFLKFLWS